jgi:hypothetical protein
MNPQYLHASTNLTSNKTVHVPLDNTLGTTLMDISLTKEAMLIYLFIPILIMGYTIYALKPLLTEKFLDPILYQTLSLSICPKIFITCDTYSFHTVSNNDKYQLHGKLVSPYFYTKKVILLYSLTIDQLPLQIPSINFLLIH